MSTAVGARRYTTRFAASRYLYAQLRDSVRVELDGVIRSWGYPGVAAGMEIVWVGAITPADQEPAAIGRGTRQEDYLVNIYVDVAVDTADPADVGARQEELVHVIEDIVHDDAHLGGAVMWAQVVEVSTALETQPATESVYAGTVRVQVGCQARI